jgi:hypothetical protein
MRGSPAVTHGGLPRCGLTVDPADYVVRCPDGEVRHRGFPGPNEAMEWAHLGHLCLSVGLHRLEHNGVDIGACCPDEVTRF